MTTTESGQYANVTRKTWESWEAAEVAGESAPKSAVELMYAKLERICASPNFRAPNGTPREILVIFRVMDQATGDQLPIDAVAADNFLGVEPGPDGTTVIKSIAVAWRTGRPYVHRDLRVGETGQWIASPARAGIGRGPAQPTKCASRWRTGPRKRAPPAASRCAE